MNADYYCDERKSEHIKGERPTKPWLSMSQQQTPVQSSLLRWGIEHSDPEALQRAAEEASKDQAKCSTKFDKDLIEHILGKDDAVHIKEQMAVFLDESLDQSDREVAFENLEMLLESIDNAKDMKPLGQWDLLCPIILQRPVSGLAQQQPAWFVSRILSVMALCAQNNPIVQSHLGERGLVEQAVEILKIAELFDVVILRKTVLLISALVQHHRVNYDRFQAARGFSALEDLLNSRNGDLDENLQLRIAFFVRSLMPPADLDELDEDEEYRAAVSRDDLCFDPLSYPSISSLLGRQRD